MAFTDLPDGEHTVNGKSFTKSGNAFTLDGKTLNAKEIEKATRTTSEKMRKTAEETMSDAEVDHTPKSEAQPEQKPTTSDKMRGKGKKKAEAKPSDQSEVSEKSDAFVMKDGKTLKNDSGETVLIYHDKSPKGALWGNKKFKSENHYGMAQYVIIGDDVHIRMINSFPKTGKRYIFFTIPDFRNKTISEMQQAIQKIAPDSTYPLGRNFDDLLHDLHDHGMRVYPSGLRSIKFSIIGEEGAARMDNAEILLDNLRIAREMTADGKDAKTIKLATGWEKGKDGKWRMEIPDLKWKIEATLPDDTKYQRTPFEMVHTAGKLSEYINAPELFQAYPELKNIKLNFRELAWAQDGYFDENRNEIVVNSEKLSPIAESIDYIEDQKGKDARKQELVETIENILIHEVQHAIQKIEGFAKGGSLEADKKLSPEAAHKARANALRKHLADAGFEVSRDEAMLLTDENADDTALEKLWDNLVDKGMTEEKYNKIFQKIPLFIGYHNLAGEVESRNSVTRSKMSMDERRQSLLDETADVAEEDRIYLMDEAGVSELAKANITDINNLYEYAKSINLPENHIFFKILSRKGSIFNGRNRVYLESKGVQSGLGKHILELGYATRGGIYLQEFIDNFEKAFNGKRRFDAKNKEGFYELLNSDNKPIYTFRTYEKDGKEYFESFYGHARGEKKTKKIIAGLRTSHGLLSDLVPINPQHRNNITSPDSKINPTSEKNPENSSGGVKFSKRGDAETEQYAVENKLPDVPDGIDLKSASQVRNYLREAFSGRKFRIDSDGRLVAIDFPGIRSGVEKRGKSRQSLFDMENIVKNSYPVGYEFVDLEHLEKSQDINGQFIYAALVNMMNKEGKRENYIVTIKLDDSHADKKAQFKDISVKKRSLYVGQTQNSNSVNVNPPADRILTIQQIVDFVKNDFKDSPIFTENIPPVIPENSSGGVKLSMSSDLGDNRINWDNKNGMGATPDNANIDYRGFQIELSAKDFRNLTPSGRTTGDLTKMKKAISDGEGVASPTLYADWNEQKKRWEVTDHV